ncbi:MATE family efflux transporter [Clostridium sp. NSJ-27]|uniref:Probable multidrug resistance protein NorM n=2 Tax=Clostridium facile TaxID=2763035 RepID=A0ABR7IPX3_9CLOT|nr:MATE family efflux transporter [Clostridium facile]
MREGCYLKSFSKKLSKNSLMFDNQMLVKLIIPLIIEQFLTVTVGMADSVMIASVGEAAVSGVSLVDTVNILLINVFAAMATGGAVVAGQYLGQKRQKEACKAADQLVLFITFFSIIIMVLMYLCKNWILHGVFGKIDSDVMGYANTYLVIVSLSIPFIALYNGGAALFRTMGNSNISMIITLIMNIINVIGNAILIYRFQMGVAGAAIPTLFSRIVAAILIIVLLRKQNLLVHLTKPFQFKLNFHFIKKILRIGIPNGLENSMFQLGKILVLSLVAGFGTASIAANAVSNTIANFQILPGMAIGLATITVVSRCVGAGDYEQVRFYTRKLLRITYLSMILINIIIDLGLPLILWIYNLTPETGMITKQLILYHSICCVTIWPFSFTLPNTLRASNDVRFCMVTSIVSMWVWRIAFSFVLAQFLHLGVFGVWVAMTIDWLFRAICFVIRYRGSRWQLKSN